MAVAAVLAVAAAAVGSGVLPFPGRDGREGPSSIASAQPAPSVPFLTVELERDDKTAAALPPPAEGVLVVIQVSVRGFVPQLTRNGSPAVGPDNLHGLTLNFGDGSTSGHSPEEHVCMAAAPLVEVDSEFVIKHVDQRPGQYTVTYHTAACEPIGTVTQTLALTAAESSPSPTR